MTRPRTVPVADATGDVRSMYERAQKAWGFVPNWARAFSLRPGVMDGWMALLGSVSRNLSRREYELATLAAARALGSSYCSLAHASALRKLGVAADADLAAIARGADNAPLTDRERAMMRFAAKVATAAPEIDEEDHAALRRVGLDDTEIFDVAATAAARCFFARLLDAVGVQPDSSFLEEGEATRAALVVGRPIAEDPTEALS